MLYTDHERGGSPRARETTLINAATDADPAHPSLSTAWSPWEAIVGWAEALADRVAGDQPAQHVSVFVHDRSINALRLVGQVWGAGEDTGAVVVGIWTVPLEGSVSGRVFRTRAAALSADVSLDPDYRAFPGGETRSSLTVPLVRDEVAVGVINVEAPWMSAFSIADYGRLTTLAATAAAGMPAAPMLASATAGEAAPPVA